MSTAPARLGAFLAVAHCSMALAFLCALVADSCAQFAICFGAFAGATHGRSCGFANLGAINVKSDAPRKHLHVLLLQALCGAVIAGLGTCIAGLDAVGKLLVGH